MSPRLLLPSLRSPIFDSAKVTSSGAGLSPNCSQVVDQTVLIATTHLKAKEGAENDVMRQKQVTLPSSEDKLLAHPALAPRAGLVTGQRACVL